MKNSAQSLFEAAKQDNQQNIKESGLSVSEFFQSDFENTPESFFCWMTEEEIEQWESGIRDEIKTSFQELIES